MEVQLELNAVRIVDEELPDGKTRHAPLAKGYAEGAATLARVDKAMGRERHMVDGAAAHGHDAQTVQGCGAGVDVQDGAPYGVERCIQ